MSRVCLSLASPCGRAVEQKELERGNLQGRDVEVAQGKEEMTFVKMCHCSMFKMRLDAAPAK